MSTLKRWNDTRNNNYNGETPRVRMTGLGINRQPGLFVNSVTLTSGLAIINVGSMMSSLNFSFSLYFNWTRGHLIQGCSLISLNNLVTGGLDENVFFVASYACCHGLMRRKICLTYPEVKRFLLTSRTSWRHIDLSFNKHTQQQSLLVIKRTYANIHLPFRNGLTTW